MLFFFVFFKINFTILFKFIVLNKPYKSFYKEILFCFQVKEVH